MGVSRLNLQKRSQNGRGIGSVDSVHSVGGVGVESGGAGVGRQKM